MAKKLKVKKTRTKEGLSGKIERALELPLGTLTNHSHIEFSGNCRVVIDGCEGIIEYTEDTIRLSTNSGEIRFTGIHLSMNCMTEDNAVIEGKILSMEFLS